MNSAVAARLVELNRQFYEKFATSFSATRGRLQPGIMRILDSLHGDESILDLGCGNGGLARELQRRGHRGRYLGLDFSLPMLREAQSNVGRFSAAFLRVDLIQFPLISSQLPVSGLWPLVTCFAALHHIPGESTRLDLLHAVHSLMGPRGRFLLSNWQFLNSDRLKARIRPWELAGLSQSDVDEDDYLLDWKRDGYSLRYAHHFSPEELSALASQSGFEVIDAFLSDGEGGKLGLYQVWQKKTS